MAASEKTKTTDSVQLAEKGKGKLMKHLFAIALLLIFSVTVLGQQPHPCASNDPAHNAAQIDGRVSHNCQLESNQVLQARMNKKAKKPVRRAVRRKFPKTTR